MTLIGGIIGESLDMCIKSYSHVDSGATMYQVFDTTIKIDDE